MTLEFIRAVLSNLAFYIESAAAVNLKDVVAILYGVMTMLGDMRL